MELVSETLQDGNGPPNGVSSCGVNTLEFVGAHGRALVQAAQPALTTPLTCGGLAPPSLRTAAGVPNGGFPGSRRARAGKIRNYARRRPPVRAGPAALGSQHIASFTKYWKSDSVLRRTAIYPLGAQRRISKADALDFPRKHPGRRLGLLVHGELDARRVPIDCQHATRHTIIGFRSSARNDELREDNLPSVSQGNRCADHHDTRRRFGIS